MKKFFFRTIGIDFLKNIFDERNLGLFLIKFCSYEKCHQKDAWGLRELYINQAKYLVYYSNRFIEGFGLVFQLQADLLKPLHYSSPGL